MGGVQTRRCGADPKYLAQWRIQDFQEEVAPTTKVGVPTISLITFSQKLHVNKKKLDPEVGRASLAPPRIRPMSPVFSQKPCEITGKSDQDGGAGAPLEFRHYCSSPPIRSKKPQNKTVNNFSSQNKNFLLTLTIRNIPWIHV